MSDRPAALPYRPCVGVMLLNRDGQVLVGRRIDTPGAAWQMPQGGIDAGEAPLAAAWREMREEIGTDKAALLGESSGWLRYELPPDLAGKMWGGRYRGQEQKWFAFCFTGTDEDIRLDHHAPPEFCEWRWAELADLPRLIVPFKRDLYAQLVAEFAPLAERCRQA